MHHLNETAGALTLMGSGEMSPGMAETHRRLMRAIDGAVKPAFIDTPAGFELNVSSIREKAIEYFRQNFALDLAIVSFPNAAQATPLTMEPAMRVLRNANYIFSGPGSPTYAVRNWRGTPIFETMAGKLAAGAQMVMASAATLAMGRHTIPVYEIYKVGEEPHWVDGLNLLGRYGLELAIVPHWNNNSGGGHDTTHCFIGEERFNQMRAMLPASVTILGIDEYTACTLMLHDGVCRVSGAGVVTVMRADGTQTFRNGDAFSFDVLRAPDAAKQNDYPSAITEATLQHFRQALRDHIPGSAVGYVHSLMETMRQHDAGAVEQANTQMTIREMLTALAIWLDEHQHAGEAAPIEDALVEPLMQAAIAVRAGLRANKQYALADELRKRLSDAGVELADSPQGTTWKRTTS
jgi:cyanophycinase-like exopeptidase